MTTRITRAGILTALGPLEETWQSLVRGESGLKQITIEKMEEKWPLGVIKTLSGEFGTIHRLESLLDQLLADIPPLNPDCELICATTKGAIDELLTKDEPTGGQCYQIGDEIKERLGLSGKATTISAACASGTIALIQGALRVQQGSSSQVLVIGLDLVSRFVLGGFASLKALSATGCRPFDRKRDGLSLGEAGAWLLLEKKPTGDSPFNGVVSSWGIGCDATHITAPCRHGSGLIATLGQLKTRSQTPIGAINGHGTGTVYNDAMELLAFGSTLESQLPLFSVKGGIGHTLGAAGLVESIVCLKALEEGCIPPTVGLDSPEESTSQLSGHEVLPLGSPSIVNCNSGFGGINAAVLLTQAD
ncbi:MAG: beta-ketoacyl synthase N-terminal-like domain-containing protein [Thermodesulfobacteriota bacterium]